MIKPAKKRVATNKGSNPHRSLTKNVPDKNALLNSILKKLKEDTKKQLIKKERKVKKEKIVKVENKVMEIPQMDTVCSEERTVPEVPAKIKRIEKIESLIKKSVVAKESLSPSERARISVDKFYENNPVSNFEKDYDFLAKGDYEKED